MTKVGVTKKQLTRAFTEWEEDRREKPDEYCNEAERLDMTPETFGGKCGAHLLGILKEQS